MKASCALALVLAASTQRGGDAFTLSTRSHYSRSFGAATAVPTARGGSSFSRTRLARGEAAAATAAAAAGVLRMSTSDAFDVNAALAELRQSVSTVSEQNSAVPSQPKLPLPSLPTTTQVLDALPKLHLPNVPELPNVAAAPPSISNPLPPELMQPTGDTWIFSRLSEAASKASESSVAAASKLLPPTPEKYSELSTQVADAYAQASLDVSNALNALVAANPSLGPAVAHLRSSLTDALASVGEAYAAGNALVPEEYKPLAATVAIGAGATALGMALAAASEEGRASRESKNAPLPREYDLPGMS